MRKLSVFNLVTLDGFFQGPNHGISWRRVDTEFNDFAGDLTGSSDTLLFGRATYQRWNSTGHPRMLRRMTRSWLA